MTDERLINRFSSEPERVEGVRKGGRYYVYTTENK